MFACAGVGGDGCAINQSEIAATDNEIERLVYELYELTAEEIVIIEESG